MQDEESANGYPLRAPCICGSNFGSIEIRNGQACVFCARCAKWLYNAPKAERGLAPEPVRSDGVGPRLRYEIAERAGFRCELCGADNATHLMHVGHLISERDVRRYGLPLELADHPDNLAWLCDACNLGMGARSLPVHQLILYYIRRSLGGK